MGYLIAYASDGFKWVGRGEMGSWRRWVSWAALIVLGSLAVAALVVAVGMAAELRRPRSGVEVTQTGLDGFAFDMLHDRQRVLVVEPVAAVGDLLRAWFGWNLVGSSVAFSAPFRNASKYLVLHAAPGEKSAVEVRNPAHVDAVLRVLVPPRAVLMVPYGWDVLDAPTTATVTPIDDPVTWVMRFVTG